ncbi:MAG TPA: hypothetical protein HA272_04140 [Methanoregula sp.]|nr:hypothetical protein [Methanoregula sp.]
MPSRGILTPVRVVLRIPPALLLLCLVVAVAVAPLVSAATVPLRVTPTPNATMTLAIDDTIRIPVSPMTTTVSPRATMPQKTILAVTIAPSRTPVVLRTLVGEMNEVSEHGDGEPDPDAPGRDTGTIEKDVHGDLLQDGDTEYDRLTSPDGEILAQTASEREEVIPVGNEDRDEGADESPFVGEFFSREMSRQQALAALQEDNPAISGIRGDENSVSIETKKHAKIFGVFSAEYSETLTIDRFGQVTVGEPWWLGLADRGKTGTIDQEDTLQKQQQLIQALSNIAKMLEDTAGNSIRKIG